MTEPGPRKGKGESWPQRWLGVDWKERGPSLPVRENRTNTMSEVGEVIRERWVQTQ